MEELAKSLQQAQAAVLGVQDDLALLRAHVEEEAEGRGYDSVVKAAAVGLETSVALNNPYYMDLHTSVHRRQEAASLLLQRCAHIFYEEFGALEEKAARLENVRVKEKELQSAKKSMQRYFDAHSKELAEERDRHDGELRLEWERRHHLEDGLLRLQLELRQQRLAHNVLLIWMKKAMMRNLAREYTRRREATRETYQCATCDALVHQQRVTAAHRALCTWRSRMQQRRCQRLKTAAAEAEQRAQFFRDELAATQQTLHERLNRDVSERDRIATAVATQEKECAQHEDEVHRLRTALRDMTVEFSERTRTYVRQQEAIEQLFARKEATLRDTVCSLQAALTTERQAHVALAESSEHFVDHVNACWKAQLQELTEAVRRKEEYAYHTVLGLTGRLQHRHGSLRQEAAKLARDVDTLAPLSERCVRLENALAESEQLLKRSKASSQSWERRYKTAHVVGALLTDRVASAGSAALRARSFIRWLGHSHTISSERSQRSICSLSDKMEAQRRQLLVQQQEQSSRHQAEVAQLRDELEQLRRANMRLQSQLEAAARTQRERDGAYYDSEVRNGELSAAMLREKMERRGVEEKWWSSRASGLLLQEAQQRLYIEAQEGQWWGTLLMREGKVLKVWTASLHCDAAQLTAVCEGWQQHCHQIEAAHTSVQKTAAARTACALERGVLHAQTLVVWTSWREWAQQRRGVAALEARLSESRREMIERHGKELARSHTSHDMALQRLQREHTLEKTQLQSIHQERCAALRRAQAEELAQLSERHAQQLKIAQTAYAADVAQRDEEAGAMQEQLDHVGCLVVEYCAQATYSRWRAWAAERQAQRTVRQRRGMIAQLWEWHTVRTTMIDACGAAKASLLASSTIEIAQERAVEARWQVQHMAQETELCHSQQHKLQAAKEVAEEEAAYLRGELQHVRTLYDAEAHYTERLLCTATEERRAYRSTLMFTVRMAEWRELAHCSFAEHQVAAMEAFADAAGKAMTEVSVARSAELAGYVAQVEEEVVVVPNARASGAIASPSGESGAEKARTSDGDSTLDMSGQGPGEREVDEHSADVSTGDGGGQRRSTCAMAVTPPLVQVVPEDLVSRLRSIESYVMATGDSCEAEYEVDTASSEQCGPLLTEPFLEARAPSSPHLAAASSHEVEQAGVPLAVRHLLELVRLAALRGAAAHKHDRAAELAVIQEKRARSEEALASLRESMGGLLAEQRSLAEEMHADAQQRRQQYSTSREVGSAQASLASTESWHERLSALADRYTRVLETFCTDVTGHQETFYSVKGMLVEADEFSERLLQRFAENARAMAQLRAQVPAQVSGIASAHGSGDGPDVTLPADMAATVGTVPPSSPEPKAPSLPVTPPSSPGLPDNPIHAACSQRSSFGATTSAVGSTSPAASTPERRGLRDRVRFLERLLVETKVQLAEAKSLVGVAHRAASLAKASAEAEVWAAQDAEDFSQLAVSKEQLLVLYAASESTTRTLMTAMREYDTQRRGTQVEMSQQLRTACAAVEDALQARHRIDVERYEAKVRALSDSLAAAAREQSRAETRYGELEQQLKSEAANWAEKYSRDTQLIRQSCMSEIDELTGHQRLLEDELQQCRRATQSSVQQAVERQTELLRLEYTEKLRRFERNVARMATEKALLEGRLRSVEEDCVRQVQLERAAVARLQHRLTGDAGAVAEVACVATLASWEMHLVGAAELYARCAADKAAWLAACVAGLMEREREQWETEVIQLRERVAFLLEASGTDPAAPACDDSFQGSTNVQESGRITSPQDKADNSSQALTVSPSPRRSNQGVSSGEGGASIAACGATAESTPRRAVSSPSAAKTSRGTQGTVSVVSHDTTPTRCRSLSVESLELSQSFLRYSQMLSDQRSRNVTRLERATALAAEVDDLLLRGAQLGHSAASQSAR
ncbi:conserved hypothetical protein [Leishmania mexicana MHOM/GT/2001/U1103]|uniref:Uncharacterized protein n=1 Tax=Leishmania mexicana (strain MHOM/GT/2001/U1103) TaxID=929439 RepID=E9B299_LEIMU|nr:conserved hypothetical protein [Leishmania mexicana MHOM/GT/2001/U1103]CBZ29360.1 conserved hypothetical protein [Leishmania mexicana MHOM/GT/2001/U1103]